MFNQRINAYLSDLLHALRCRRYTIKDKQLDAAYSLVIKDLTNLKAIYEE